MANSYITITSGVLTRRFRVLYEGYVEIIMRNISQDLTLGTAIDITVGGVYEALNMIVRARDTETEANYGTTEANYGTIEANYGTIDELRTIILATDPTAARCTITLNDGRVINGWFLDPISATPLTIQVEGDTAWSVFQLIFTIDKYQSSSSSKSAYLNGRYSASSSIHAVISSGRKSNIRAYLRGAGTSSTGRAAFVHALIVKGVIGPPTDSIHAYLDGDVIARDSHHAMIAYGSDPL